MLADRIDDGVKSAVSDKGELRAIRPAILETDYTQESRFLSPSVSIGSNQGQAFTPSGINVSPGNNNPIKQEIKQGMVEALEQVLGRSPATPTGTNFREASQQANAQLHEGSYNWAERVRR